MSSDAIVLLKADHKEIRRLFREFQEGLVTQKQAGQAGMLARWREF